MPEYLNPHPHDLYLTGPNGETVHIRKNRRIMLPEYFDKYTNKTSNRGYLISIEQTRQLKQHKPHMVRSARHIKPDNTNKPIRHQQHRPQIVGRAKMCTQNDFTSSMFAISNNIGIGILTYNRPSSLKRLVNSILKYTDIYKTTIFISDDGSTDKEQIAYLNQLRDSGIVILKNNKQIGVAGNSNRLMRCLSRFANKILLNDDVEILKSGWDSFYFDAMKRTGYHHFCYRQPGVYGAEKGTSLSINGIVLNVVNDKPHGAVLAFDHAAFSKIGYFDEQFGQYGMEHVDWSARIADSKLQPQGFFDVNAASMYFVVHQEQSAVENRIEKFRYAKSIYSSIKDRKEYIEPTDISIVPRVSCIIPFREIGRKDAILTVANNIRAQRFPDIEITMTEEDDTPKISDIECMPAKHVFTVGRPKAAFNKSKAWNIGVSESSGDILVLHDADTLAQNNYIDAIYNELSEVESCHLCRRIFYVSKNCTDTINASGVVDNPICDRMVDYFEGGSIACKRSAYWKIGGFVEDFVGYGVEDCDFYYRLSKATQWREKRTFDLLHLYHGRVDGWDKFHADNKEIGAALSAMSIDERIAKQQLSLLRNNRKCT